MKLPTPNMTNETRKALIMEVAKLSMPQNVQRYLVGLPLYEEEGLQMIEFLKNNPNVTEREAINKVDEITLAVTRKLGMTASQRDRLYSII